MVQPIDYMGMLNRPDLGESLLSGLRAGAALRQARDERQERQQASEMREQYSADLQNALSNPTAGNFAALSAKYPQQREAFKQSWDLLSKEQQDSEFGAGVQVYHALQGGNTDSALKVVDDQIAAMEGSGEDASAIRNIRSQILADPNRASGFVGLTLSSIDPEKWSSIAAESRAAESAPFELSEKESKAQSAAVKAKFAESQAAQDLAKGGWEIQKLANDIGISRQNSKIAALNAQISRESNDLKREELQQKLDDKQAERDAALRTKSAEVESSRASMDNMLNTADRILKTPMDVIGSASGPVSSRVPTLSQDTADFEELVNTLGSQSFMAQIPNIKGMGALSNAEGEKLQSALQNLSLRQSPERLVENVKEAQRLILKSRQTLADRYGVPDVLPDRPVSSGAAMPQGFRVLGVEGQ